MSQRLPPAPLEAASAAGFPTSMSIFARNAAMRASAHDRLETEAEQTAHALSAGSAAMSARLENAATRRPVAASPPTVPPEVATVLRGSGTALDTATRLLMEGHFGYDFRSVRIHSDASAARSSRALEAQAYTVGSHIVFDHGRYAPGSPASRHLLAHELAHVVQQSRGLAPSLQRRPAATDVAALERQLQRKLRERSRLQQEIDASQQNFVDERYKERSQQTLEETVPKMKAQAQGDMQSDIPSHGLKILKKAIDVVRGNGEFTLNVRFELAYQSLSDDEGMKRAADDIPRLEKTIGEAWTVDMTKGRYTGNKFRLVPKISYRTNSTKRSNKALQINVRGKDKDPSTGTYWTGEISLAEAHLQGDRIIVVAHELYHLFGYFDAYFTMETPSKNDPTKKKIEQNVGRIDPAGRADLLGMPDPEHLKKGLAAGEITQADYDRQTKNPLRVWEEDADSILYALGVAPSGSAKPPQIDPDADDFEERADAELDALRRRGEQKLAEIRKRAAGIAESMDWLDKTERAIAMDKDIETLRRRILDAKAGSSAGPAPGNANP